MSSALPGSTPNTAKTDRSASEYFIIIICPVRLFASALSHNRSFEQRLLLSSALFQRNEGLPRLKSIDLILRHVVSFTTYALFRLLGFLFQLSEHLFPARWTIA